MTVKDIAAADAVKLFAKQGIQVQVAKPVKVRDKETGVERQTMKVETVDLAASHIISAKDHGDRVVIVTHNGQKHEVRT